MRGRKPQPTQLKLVTGNPGRRKLNLNEPRPASGLPTPPAHLSAEAKMEWRRTAPELHRIGVLTRLDRAALAAYCQCYGRWRQAEEALAEMGKAGEGLTVATAAGNVINNPLLGIANKAAADMIRYAAEFGMTPSSRSRVTAQPPLRGDLDKYLS